MEKKKSESNILKGYVKSVDQLESFSRIAHPSLFHGQCVQSLDILNMFTHYQSTEEKAMLR